MSALLIALGARALKFIVASPTLIAKFGAAVKQAKAESPSDAMLQSLPDDEAAIRMFAEAVARGERENADLVAWLEQRKRDEDAAK